ncbi:fibronectin type III domain-containing protein [Candidatus Bathyarchaeota archaeon]|nr:fibronectin type III domain-containing protein [Candidatus Bathyarchaeota archaeon]
MNSKRVASVLFMFFVTFSVLSFLGAPRQASAVGSESSDSIDRSVSLVLTVDPEGRITVKGAMNDTTMTTAPINFTLSGGLDVTEDAASTEVKLLIPAENATKFPFNATTLSLLMDYAEGRLDNNLNFTMILPPKQVLSQYVTDATALDMIEYFLNSTDLAMDATSVDGEVDVNMHHMMVANLTDLIRKIGNSPLNVSIASPFVLNLDYSKGEYVGSIRFTLLPGLPLGDLEIDVTGNLTNTSFNGTIHVVYGTYPSIGTINQSFIDSIESYAKNTFNASQDVQGSLLNITQGWFKCSNASIVRKPVTGGEDVTFKVDVSEPRPGAYVYIPFIQYQYSYPLRDRLIFPFALNDTLHNIKDAKLELVYTPADTKLDVTMSGAMNVRDLMTQLLEPKDVPEQWPEWQYYRQVNSTILPDVWLMMKMTNATAYSFEDSSLHMEYHHSDRRVDVNFTSLMDAEGLYDDLSELLSELSHAQVQALFPPEFEPVILALQNITATRFVNVTALKASLTYANGVANLDAELTTEGDTSAEIDYLKNIIIQYQNFSGLHPWQSLYVNETQIDIVGMKASWRMDNISAKWRVEGLKVRPPTDPINATAFKLDRFFNLTSDSEFPGSREQFNVTIIGGSNASHKVTLSKSTSVPEPDLTLLDAHGRATLMAWNNITMSALRDIRFILVLDPPLPVTLAAPTQNDVTETSISLSWTENGDPDFVRYEIFRSTSAGVLGVSVANVTGQGTRSYTVGSLSSGTTSHFTVRVVDSAGLFTDSNQVNATTKVPIWTQPWFMAAIIAVIALAVSVVFLMRRRSS